MAHVLSEQRMDVGVEFHNFCLQEADEDFVPLEYADGQEADDPFLTVYEGRLDVRSGGHTHTAVLTAQIWDSAPPEEAAGTWEVRDEAELYSETGELNVLCFGGPTQGATVELGAPRVRWHTRVFSRGRKEVAKLATQGVPRHVEQYLVQFWPSGA